MRLHRLLRFVRFVEFARLLTNESAITSRPKSQSSCPQNIVMNLLIFGDSHCCRADCRDGKFSQTCERPSGTYDRHGMIFITESGPQSAPSHVSFHRVESPMEPLENSGTNNDSSNFYGPQLRLIINAPWLWKL